MNVLAVQVSLTANQIFVFIISLGWGGSRKRIVHKWGIPRIDAVAYFAFRRRHTHGPLTLHVGTETADRVVCRTSWNPIGDVTPRDKKYSTGSGLRSFDFE